MSGLRLAGGAYASADVAAYARRVARYDADAVVRLVAAAGAAVFFAQTPFEALVARALPLAEPAERDLVLEAPALAARAGAGGEVLELPPAVPALRWTAGLPPRGGWRETARLPVAAVERTVAQGVAEFRRRAAESEAGTRAVLESLAADVWSRELSPGVPVRLAHAAHAYGFLGGAGAGSAPPAGEVVLRSAGPWRRLDAAYGSTFERESFGLGLLL